MINVEQLTERIQWFLVAFNNKHRLKLSYAHHTIEKSLGHSVEVNVVLNFLRKNRYKHVEVDIVLELLEEKSSDDFIEDSTNIHEKPVLVELDDIDDILSKSLEPNQPSANPSNQFNNPSHKMNEFMLDQYEKSRDKMTMHHLVIANMSLVRSIAARYTNYMNHCFTMEDLVQEGVFGLMIAIDRFDRNLGGNLSTYATPWIKQRIIRAIIDKGTIVRIPVHAIEQIRKLKKIEAQLQVNLDAEVIPMNRICDEADISEVKYRELKLAEHRFIGFTSLNQYIGTEDGDTEILEFIPNDHQEVFSSLPFEYKDPYEVTERAILSNNLRMLLDDRLTERECSVISLRYGLDDGRRRTLEEVGKVFGLTRERIRQIEKKAFRKLKAIKKKANFIWIPEGVTS